MAAGRIVFRAGLLLIVPFSLMLLPVLSLEVPAERREPADWPTLHGDRTRSGFHASFPAPPLRLAWRKELHREVTGPRAEAIIGDGPCFLGTYAGNLYAWDAATGTERWVHKTNGPICHAPAHAEGTVYFGSMDRTLTALDTNGKPRWVFTAEEGISTHPLVVNGLVLFGDRGGTFYALKADDGKKVWFLETGGPILAPASTDPGGGLAVVASEDMHAYCLDVKSGKLRWKSRQMAGVTTRDYAPLLVGGLALLGTSPITDFHKHTLDAHQTFLLGRAGVKPGQKEVRYLRGTADDIKAEQEAILARLKQFPEEQTFYAFRLEDGSEPWVAPVLYTSGLHNPPTPPCVHKPSGAVYLLTRSAYTVWDGGGEVRPLVGVGKLDLATGRVELVEHGHKSSEPLDRPAGRKDMPSGSFNTIGDETLALSATPDLLLCTHQGTLGSMNLTTGRLAVLWGKRDTYAGFYGPGTFGWEDQGGLEKAARAGQPFGMINEWHGPARAIVSTAGGRAYLNVGSQVLCLEGGKP